MLRWGLKLRRTPEEQRAFEEKVERASYEMTVRVLTFLKVDVFCRWLQESSSRHPKVVLSLLSFLMIGCFLLIVFMGTGAPAKKEPTLMDALEEMKALKKGVDNLGNIGDTARSQNGNMFNNDTEAGKKPYTPHGAPANE